MSSEFSDWSTEDLIERKEYLVRILNMPDEKILFIPKRTALSLGIILFLAGIVGTLESGIDFYKGALLLIGGRATYLWNQEYKIDTENKMEHQDVTDELLRRERMRE
jgi:hypothetical protein